jgi:hypothetical protein
MAKINRYDGNVVAFGSEAIGTERTVFGDTTQSDSLDQNLNSFYRRGFGIVDANEAPTKQDFNAVNFTNSQLIAYLHQIGVPEWNTNQEYHTDSFVNRNGELYISLSDSNIGNDPETDSVNWIIYSNNFVKKTGNETINGVKTFTESPIVPTPTTDYQTATKEYVDTNTTKILPLKNNITVTVGLGGEYSTINEALEYLVETYYPAYKNTGITATINLLSGFVMQEQVLVRGLNLGWITITGEDAETIIDNTFLTINFTTTDYGFSSYPAFGVSKGGTLPRIDQLFSFNVAGVGGGKHGVMAIGASAEILENKGIKDAGSNGIYATQGSTINAYSANASGAGTSGIVASQGSTINASSANASGAGTFGIYADQGSTINAYSANASGAGNSGIYTDQGSTINAHAATGTLSQTANTLTNNGIIYQ